jgi:hypothetical protein
MKAMADERFRLRHALLTAACGLLLCLSGTLSAYAQEAEEEDTFEQKIIKNFLGGLGVDVGRPGIDYRERSPLVVPPSRDLPPPANSIANSNPAWPKEQVKRRAAAAPKQNVRAGAEDPGTSAAMTPDELRRAPPARPGSSRITDPSQSGSVDDPNIGRTSRPQELGSTNLFTWGNLMRSPTETATFPGEPSRSALTQPPPGYQTPSPAAPYGTVTDAPSGWKIPTILSRPEGSADAR